MRSPAALLLVLCAALGLAGCKVSTCGDACNNFGKVCKEELAFAKIKFDALGCASSCEQSTGGCSSKNDTLVCMAEAANCGQWLRCRDDSKCRF